MIIFPGKFKGLRRIRSSRKTSQVMNSVTCHNMGLISINFSMREDQIKNKKNIFEAHIPEDNDQEEEERTK